MPFIKVYFNENLPKSEIEVISESIHDSLITNFNVPKDDIFHLFLPYSDKHFIFNECYNLSDNKLRTCKMTYIDILCGDGYI